MEHTMPDGCGARGATAVGKRAEYQFGCGAYVGGAWHTDSR